MRNKPNPRIIGLFVIGAIALFATALVALGGGFFNRDLPPAVVYFDGSVNGLYVGAPVNFRGVRVGSVTRVDLVIDSRDLTARIQLQERRLTVLPFHQIDVLKLVLDVQQRKEQAHAIAVTRDVEIVELHESS